MFDFADAKKFLTVPDGFPVLVLGDFVMSKQLKKLASEAIPWIKPYLSAKQLSGLIVKCAGKEGEFYMHSLIVLADRVSALPVIEDLPMADTQLVYLHYRCGDTHWYITGLSADLLPGGRMARAFVVSPTKHFHDCGLILLPGLFKFGGDTDLDLFFEPSPLALLKPKAVA